MSFLLLHTGIYMIYIYINILYYITCTLYIIHMYTHAYISLWLFVSQPSSEFLQVSFFGPRWNDRDWDPMIGTSNLIRSKATGRIFRWKCHLRSDAKSSSWVKHGGDETYAVIYIYIYVYIYINIDIWVFKSPFVFAHPAHGPPANTIGGLHIQEEKSG